MTATVMSLEELQTLLSDATRLESRGFFASEGYWFLT